MKIRVQDFQSLGNVEIEAEGLTVVVGRSNLGKSALIRAVEGALFNKAGEEFVREGKTRTEVELTGLPVVDGTTLNVLWEKGHNLNQYTINGVSYAKVGVSAPLKLAEAGYRDVWIGDKERNKGQWLRPQVQQQHDPLFLLTQTGSFISDVMSVVSRLAALQVASGKCTADLKKQKQLLGLRRGDLDVAKKKLVALQPIVALHDRVLALEGKLKQAVAAQEVVAEARELVVQRRAFVTVCALGLPPGTQVPTDLGDRYGEAQRLVVGRSSVLASGLVGRTLPETVTPGFEALAGHHTKATTLRTFVVSRPGLAALAGKTLPETVTPGFGAIEQGHATVLPLRTLTAARPRLAALAGKTLPKGKNYTLALGKLEEWTARSKEVAGLNLQRSHSTSDHYTCITGVRAAKQEHEQAELALGAVLAELRICPVCDRPMGAAA